MVKKVQMYAEKVAARYDPHSNPVWGSKSWQVWNRVKMKLDIEQGISSSNYVRDCISL